MTVIQWQKHYLKEPQQNKKRNFVLSFHSITDINYQTAFKGIIREKEVEKRNNVSGVRYSARYFTCIISLSPHSNLTRQALQFHSGVDERS